ncbi:hypothetical protein [Pontibacter rugosus]|uniref:Uncharacterized protein n=1 Tax=Pontibacter rugosus TaxID=1745966 RepID=A0ABW3SV49_9BACT
MYIKKIKPTLLSLTVAIMATLSMASCNKGTEPGETNVERSGIVEEGSLVGSDEDKSNVERDTLVGESHYDHADHEEHEDNNAKVLGDGAYDGKGNGVERDEVQ